MSGKSNYPEATVKKAITLARKVGPFKAAEQMGLSDRTVRHWLKRGLPSAAASQKQILEDAVRVFRIHGPDTSVKVYELEAKYRSAYQSHWPRWSDFKADVIKAAGMTPTDEALRRREAQRHVDRIATLQSQLKQAQREINAGEDLRQSVFGLVDQPLEPPRWTFEAPKAGDSTPGIPMLFASDFQWGEVIKANELDGINAFNSKVASARYKRLIERTIDLCFAHMVNPKYPGILYLRGGDMVSGDIHQELRETNDLQSIPAAIDLIEHEAAGIEALAERFGRVWVISVPGNHGRTTMKPHAKQYVETNYDYLIACMLERHFRGDKRVQFMTPLSGDSRFKVYDWAFVLTHGDRIGSSGGQGFIGPAATITRGMKKLVDYYAALRQHVDYCLVGHFHTAMELEYGFANGSLPGYSEYAKTFRARPQPPTQWLLFVHPRNGITARWKILLDGEARMRMTGKPVEMAA
jgi:hypothetical protein